MIYFLIERANNWSDSIPLGDPRKEKKIQKFTNCKLTNMTGFFILFFFKIFVLQ